MRKSKSQHRHPSLCPKPQKASTITIDSPTSTRLPIFNKNQRVTNPSQQRCSNLLPPPSALPPLPTSEGSTPGSNRKVKDEIRQNEYQQYSRKNYLRKPKNCEGERQVDSDLVGKQSLKRPLSSEDSKRYKSKSAVKYAKYFIKQVSNNPTDPSTKELNPSELAEQVEEAENHQKQAQVIEKKQQRLQSRERSRRKQRNSIVDKLKSLKTVRSKSNRNGCSIDKELVPSIEKRSHQKRNSSKKIGGNIQNLVANQTLLARMKARSRNRRIVLKVRHQKDNALQESMNLMINSIVDRTHSDQIQTAQKIELHLELLNLLPSYVKQFNQIYQDVQCWDQLLFLAYKKFYLERLKISQALQKSCPSWSPFRLPFSAVTTLQLRHFNQSLPGIRQQQKIKKENNRIGGALRQLYNHIIQKSGKYINLLEDDSFAEQIYWLMGEEVRLLRQQQGQICRKRVNLTIKCCYLIAFLNGEQVDIESALTDGDLSESCIEKFFCFLKEVTE